LKSQDNLKILHLKRISRVVPIDSALKTNFDAIINKIRDLSLEKIQAGDTFNVNCDVMNYPKLTEPQIKNFGVVKLLGVGDVFGVWWSIFAF
jgi:tRNA(Ser,Leu) C12 N-acetylase TAN1